MNLRRLITRSAVYHWRTNLAVILGVAAAVSVLAGALVVGDSVRSSLRDIALTRLGNTDAVVTTADFFRDRVAADLQRSFGARAAAPLIIAGGFVTHEPSGRRAAKVLIYGVDERFWAFNGLREPDGIFLSPALAAEIGARGGDVLLTRLQRPSQVPIESLFGRKDDVGRTIRLTLTGVLPREQLGEFALRPQQTDVRAIFAPLRRIQRDLDIRGKVNTVLLSGGSGGIAALRAGLSLDDLGVQVSVLADRRSIAVETTSGILTEPVEQAARHAGEKAGLGILPVFTYLANAIRKAERQVPYSLVSALDLAAINPDSARHAPQPVASSQDGIVLNAWTARELSAAAGDRIDLDYYLWNSESGLTTASATFAVRAIVPIEGLAADRRLAPDYPGVTAARSLADWDPPFPIDLSRIRREDERYWDEHRTTPKAFISYERGRELWGSRLGRATSIRLEIPNGQDADRIAADLRAELLSTLSPPSVGVTLVDARRSALDASSGATDFGEYFTYFSFFLVVSALLLALLFFKLGVEQRLRQIGVLRATGYTIATIRRLLLLEAVTLATAGALIGVGGAVAYALLIVYGLRTWWIGAVGTTLLQVHVTASSLLIGAGGGVIVAVVCVFVSLRAVARLSPRVLMAAQSLDAPSSTDPARARRNWRMAAAFGVTGLVLLALGFARSAVQAGAFFGAGAALLVGCLLTLAGWLRLRSHAPITGRGALAVSRLGMRSAAFRPSRSVMSVALIASAVFIIVSVDAFRREGGDLTPDPKSGTGGYVLLAESELPLVHDPNTPSGREDLLLQAPELARVRFTRFRVREGDDASCLNLYRPGNPTIIAAAPGFIEANRFSFASSLAQTDAERANPWLTLRRTFEDGTVPVIADATSLQYVLHASLGDTFSLDTGGARPVVLRFVGALRDSILQGQLVMAEERFITLFSARRGYQFFLIDEPNTRIASQADALGAVLERELQPYGVDAVTTSRRLEEFHSVENTYLSTFQALGGLGLLLGTIGLATVMFRNVLEQRRELALLRAVGYDRQRLAMMIVAEAAFLLGSGLAAGVVCAAIAIAPAWLGRGGARPGAGLVALLAGVVLAGLVSSLVATRAALAGRVLDALRAE